MGVAFRELPGGAPDCDYLSRAIVHCREAPITDAAFMGLTSRRRITIGGTIAHRRCGAQPNGTPRPGVRPAAVRRLTADRQQRDRRWNGPARARSAGGGGLIPPAGP